MTISLQARLLAQRSLIQALSVANKKHKGLAAGFTLMELLIVVIIIGVLSAIAIPAFLNQQGRARINAAQTVVMDMARACTAAQVTGEQAALVVPANITGGPCPAAGTQVDFTASATDFNLTTAPVATVTSAGATSLTTCAAATGWTAGTAPSCSPTRS